MGRRKFGGVGGRAGTTLPHTYGSGSRMGTPANTHTRQGHKGSDRGGTTTDGYLLPGDIWHGLRNTIADAMHVAKRAPQAASHVMCPMCSEVRTRVQASRGSCDSITGLCLNKKACAKRRAELDDETIKFHGLIPRRKDAP